jgi:hypothetical protein
MADKPREKSMDIDQIDLSALRRTWARRRESAAAVRLRTDPRGMTIPAREEEEGAHLAHIGKPSGFTEIDMPGFRAWRAGKGTGKGR